MEAIKLQRDIYYKLSRGVINFKKTNRDKLNDSYIKLKLEVADRLWDNFNENHNLLILKASKEDMEKEEYFTEDFYDKTEEEYITYKQYLQSALQIKPIFNNSNNNSKINVKLPQIEIPKFSGNYLDWPGFRDLFLSLVHNNADIDDVQKLHYLKTSISGEAEQLLRHVLVTKDNYITSWETLQNRYNNKRYLSNCILRRLLTQKTLNCENAKALKEVLDTTNECLKALSCIGIDVASWDVLIIYIISQKLDNETKRSWELVVSAQSNELPTFVQFQEHLETRFRALECLGGSKADNRAKGPSSSVSFHHQVSAVVCNMCLGDHSIVNCSKFNKETVDSRRNIVRIKGLCYNCLANNHGVRMCRVKTTCRICKGRHHSLLHQVDKIRSHTSPSETGIEVTESRVSDKVQSTTTHFSHTCQNVLLATALVNVESEAGARQVFRALVDQGSQASFVTESLVQMLQLKRKPVKGIINGLGADDNGPLTARSVVSFQMTSRCDPNFRMRVNAYVLRKITGFLPTKEIKENWLHLQGLHFADPSFNTPNKIDVLLGAEVYGNIINGGLIKGPPGLPIAQNTSLGWIVSGQIASVNSQNNVISMHVGVNEDDMLRQFWEIEEIVNRKGRILSEEEEKCEKMYVSNTYRDESGRYVVKLPFRVTNPLKVCGDTRKMAEIRFIKLEKKLGDSQLKNEYSKVIDEYLKLGHMREIVDPDELQKPSIYLPHHAVIREDKTTTKVRVVFDASCKGSKGVSLNECLMIGPPLQADLRHILLRWRLHPICIVADIVKMYRQVRVTDEDADYQRLLWRENCSENLKEYKLLTVTFGVAAAPYLAVKTLQQLAHDEKNFFPLAAEKIEKDFYIDDLITGCQSVEEGVKIFNELNGIMTRGGFNLQKWCSNNKELLKEIGYENKNKNKGLMEIIIDDKVKALGLTWNHDVDKFEYSVSLHPLQTPITKRKIISDISRLFDPLGWISPIIIKAKVFIQRLWLTGLGWDDELPSDLVKEWYSYRDDLRQLQGYFIPRWLQTFTSSDIELHGFSDASNAAYAAVVYVRVTDSTGNIHVNLVTSRTKVAPIKQISIPRLELCGAGLLAKLLLEVSELFNVPKGRVFAYTDSTVVLAWLQGHPSRWKTFVANRVSEILSVLDSSHWSHIQSTNNPADCASRGMKAVDLVKNRLWLHGPEMLGKEFSVPRKSFDLHTTEEAKVCSMTCTIQPQDGILDRFSSLSRAMRVLTYCRRFTSRDNSQHSKSYITSTELNNTLRMCIRQCQAANFQDDINGLKVNKHVKRSSRLLSLNPYLDKDDVLRVGGRLQKSELSHDMQHPVLLPYKHKLTELVVADAHFKTLHGGPQLMINFLRCKYWIVGVRNLVKKYFKQCLHCAKQRGVVLTQLMGQLPPARSTPSRPFSHSGVDYAGPIRLRTSKGRGQHSHKGYICLFICMATRAIHIEVVSDLTTDGFMAAFKRFVARRGHCSNIYSDNGTNFVGAARELKRLLGTERARLQSAGLLELLSNQGTTWHFIPPHSPNFGGLWEAGIKSTKTHLTRVIGNSTLTYEELSTVLTQIEACLNSRPLSAISDSPVDLSPLTPGHFLVGEPLVLPSDQTSEYQNISNLKRWHLTQRMVQTFWKRWSSEYLTAFLQRTKGKHCVKEPQINDLVLIKEDGLAPCKWLLGRVTALHPGPDNLVRVVTIQCKNNLIKRSLSKICILPVTRDE